MPCGLTAPCLRFSGTVDDLILLHYTETRETVHPQDTPVVFPLPTETAFGAILTLKAVHTYIPPWRGQSERSARAICSSYPLCTTTCGNGISIPFSVNSAQTSLLSCRCALKTSSSLTSTINFRFTPLSARAVTPRNLGSP